MIINKWKCTKCGEETELAVLCSYKPARHGDWDTGSFGQIKGCGGILEWVGSYEVEKK
jgi:hypothetical protein